MNARRIVLASLLALAGGCATEGTVGVGVAYDAWYYDPWYDWYGGGAVCCVDYPDGIGPPRPEHPIALPPGGGAKPTQPIASPPKATQQPKTTGSMSSPRPASMSRGGGGGRGGGGRR